MTGEGETFLQWLERMIRIGDVDTDGEHPEM